jgi:hypothetical protein
VINKFKNEFDKLKTIISVNASAIETETLVVNSVIETVIDRDSIMDDEIRFKSIGGYSEEQNKVGYSVSPKSDINGILSREYEVIKYTANSVIEYSGKDRKAIKRLISFGDNSKKDSKMCL